MKKIMIALVLLSGLSASADDSKYVITADTGCVLQITKENPAASLAVVCGNVTYVNQYIQPYSEMKDAAAFQSQQRADFMSRLSSANGVKCFESDTAAALVVICQSK